VSYQFLSHKLEAVTSVRRFIEGGAFPAYPLNVMMETSNLCDLKCAMCGPFSSLNALRLFSIKAEQRGFVDPAVVRSAQDILSHALIAPIFGYGEPTINPDFADFLRIGKETPTTFFTNGMNLTEEIVSLIVDNYVFEINISFSGATKELYEGIYLGGVFETVLDGIRRLSDAKKAAGREFPIIAVNSLGYKHHVEMLPDFLRVMAAAGVEVVNLKPIVPQATVPQLAHHVCIPRTEIEGVIVEQAKALAPVLGIDFRPQLFESIYCRTEEAHAQAAAAMFRAFNADPKSPVIPVPEFKTLGVKAQHLPGTQGFYHQMESSRRTGSLSAPVISNSEQRMSTATSRSTRSISVAIKT
jgi:pyruvate-formate lyase-activating enzyme